MNPDDLRAIARNAQEHQKRKQQAAEQAAERMRQAEEREREKKWRALVPGVVKSVMDGAPEILKIAASVDQTSTALMVGESGPTTIEAAERIADLMRKAGFMARVRTVQASRSRPTGSGYLGLGSVSEYFDQCVVEVSWAT